ncbi:hypothetical protein F5B18DRAFT_656639 [Nemania serpens]|nr:hypothetical protein F5B18DRAFT_656639 [Nemania serpens]
MSTSISLVGGNFFLCGPNRRNLGGATNPEFREALRHGPHVYHNFVTLGMGNNRFVMYTDRRTGRTSWDYSLPDHHGLKTALQSSHDQPIFVSLGPDGYYFVRTASGRTVWNLPNDADNYVVNATDDDPVEEVWLGANGSHVAQKRSGTQNRDLRGCYGSLDQTLRYSGSARIQALGLNLSNDRSYFLLLSDGRNQCNTTGSPFTEADFREWSRGL